MQTSSSAPLNRTTDGGALVANAGDDNAAPLPPPPPGDPSHEAGAAPGQPNPAFRWPPRRPDRETQAVRWRRPGSHADEIDETLRRTGEEPDVGALEQIERYWLGRTSEKFIDRARRRGWAPDEPGSYCPRCGGRVGLYELGPEGPAPDDPPDRVGGCGACERRRLPWTRVVRLGDYTGLLRRAIHELKFQRWRPVGTEIGELLGAALAAELSRTRIPKEACGLIPIPTPWWRRIARGVDHTEVIARAASVVCGIRVVRGLRRRWRPSQLAVTASARRSNVRGSFLVRGAPPPAVRLFVVIDDVRTTGATMMEACRTLRRGWAGDGTEAPFALWTAPLAVAVNRRRPLAWAVEGESGNGSARPDP